MMKTKHLEWDSSFFKLNIGEIVIETPVQKEIILDNLIYDVLYIKQHQDFPFDIRNYKKTFQETKLVFCKIPQQINVENQDILDFDFHPVESNELYELAYVSGHFSRFFLDKRFGVQKFKELYRMWIDNSINKQFAKKIFYTKDNDTITSFVTLQEYAALGKVGLIATLPSHQGLGLGRKLLQKVENYCFENNIKLLEIPTQKENVQACKFYLACGYDIKEELNIKHYWRD